MKFFIDTANLAEIEEANSWGIVDGVTTNPTLIAREGEPDYHKRIKEIAAIVDGPISAECLSLKADEMVSEAKELAALHPNVVIKVPMTVDGLKAVKILTSLEIRTNVTLVFSLNQALLAAKAGASFVSPFVGRLDDISHSGDDLIEKMVIAFANYDFATEIIVASVRHPLHVEAAALSGADIATIPMKVLRLLPQHPLTSIGIENFLADWKKVANA